MRGGLVVLAEAICSACCWVHDDSVAWSRWGAVRAAENGYTYLSWPACTPWLFHS